MTGLVLTPLLAFILLILFIVRPKLVGPVKEYSFLFSFSLLPTFLFQSVKEYLQDRKALLANILSFLSVFLNLGLASSLFLVIALPKSPQGASVSINIVSSLWGFFSLSSALKKEFPINHPLLKKRLN